MPSIVNNSYPNIIKQPSHCSCQTVSVVHLHCTISLNLVALLPCLVWFPWPDQADLASLVGCWFWTAPNMRSVSMAKVYGTYLLEVSVFSCCRIWSTRELKNGGKSDLNTNIIWHNWEITERIKVELVSVTGLLNMLSHNLSVDYFFKAYASAGCKLLKYS